MTKKREELLEEISASLPTWLGAIKLRSKLSKIPIDTLKIIAELVKEGYEYGMDVVSGEFADT